MKKKGFLSPREKEVCALVEEGLTNPQIGEKLSISPHTVKVHLRSIYKKYQVRNRLQLVNRLNNK